MSDNLGGRETGTRAMWRGKVFVTSQDPETFSFCHVWFLISTVQLQLNRTESMFGVLMLTAKLLLEYNHQKLSPGRLGVLGCMDPWLRLLTK